MIDTRKKLKFYVQADDIMNEQVYKSSFWKRMLMPSLIRKFMHTLRYLEYYENAKESNPFLYPIWFFYRLRYERLKERTGFDIPTGTLGYGARIAHLSTIVVNGNTRIGNYCCFSNNIVFADAQPKTISNDVFIGSNVVFAKAITIAVGCKISACTLQNKSSVKKNMLWGGVPSRELKPCEPWTSSEPYCSERKRCEDLRIKYKIDQ